jgi:hypothetical protein
MKPISAIAISYSSSKKTSLPIVIGNSIVDILKSQDGHTLLLLTVGNP